MGGTHTSPNESTLRRRPLASRRRQYPSLSRENVALGASSGTGGGARPRYAKVLSITTLSLFRDPCLLSVALVARRRQHPSGHILGVVHHLLVAQQAKPLLHQGLDAPLSCLPYSNICQSEYHRVSHSIAHCIPHVLLELRRADQAIRPIAKKPSSKMRQRCRVICISIFLGLPLPPTPTKPFARLCPQG